MTQPVRIGRYHLLDRVAVGGTAEVYRAFVFDEKGIRQPRAVKRVLSKYARSPEFVQMLAEEYRLLRQLRHANIAEVFELVQIGDQLLIAMEFVDGKDLRTLSTRALQTRLPPSFLDISFILSHALDGLHHAHTAITQSGLSLDIVHRDVSPSNILVSYDGEVKICDFGIAKGAISTIRTDVGIIKGKVRYMSPEQATGGIPLDSRSDIFSAGSVLYELCTGRTPFVAQSEVDLVFAVREANPVDPRRLNSNLPESLARIIEKAMAKNPDDRFQSAVAFRDALLRFLRAHAPRYRRTTMGRFLRHLFADDIENELRILEDAAFNMEPPSTGFGADLLKED